MPVGYVIHGMAYRMQDLSMGIFYPLGSLHCCISTYQRGLLRCLSLLGRQCEGLGTWDKQQVQIPTSFHFKQYMNRSVRGICEVICRYKRDEM